MFLLNSLNARTYHDVRLNKLRHKKSMTSNLIAANNVSSYGRDMVQNGLGFIMHSVSLKSHGPVLLSMKLLPYPVNQDCFPSALSNLNETALRRMVPAVTSLAN